MSFYIIKGDLLQQKYDAIVVPTQPSLKLEGDFGGKIARKCGEKLFLELKQYKNINISECVIANAYNLECKRLILVADPRWMGGNDNEEYNLKQSYLSCLEMAQDFGLSSIAFPLLSTGAYEFPKREAIKIAVDTITDFLDDNDLDVALVIYKENTYKTYKDIFKKYTIVGGHLNKQDEASMEEIIKERRGFKWYKSGTAKLLENGPESKALRHQLEYFMAQKGLSRTDCYSGAISKTAFNNIMAGAIPSKNTIVSLGINMGLDVYEINQLLSPLGECLDYEIERDVYIIRGIQKGMDLKCINELLVGKGFVPLKTN